jgi:hypothetical protein
MRNQQELPAVGVLQIPVTPTCTDVNGADSGADPFTCGPGFKLKDNVGSTSITGASDPSGKATCCEKVRGNRGWLRDLDLLLLCEPTQDWSLPCRVFCRSVTGANT